MVVRFRSKSMVERAIGGFTIREHGGGNAMRSAPSRQICMDRQLISDQREKVEGGWADATV